MPSPGCDIAERCVQVGPWNRTKVSLVQQTDLEAPLGRNNGRLLRDSRKIRCYNARKREIDGINRAC